jgi:hypothetical protein
MCLVGDNAFKLGCDCAITSFNEAIVEKAKKTRGRPSKSSKSLVTKSKYRVGGELVYRMHRKLATRRIEYRDPIDLINLSLNMEIRSCWYQKSSDSLGVHFIVKLNTTCDKFKKNNYILYKASPKWVKILSIFFMSRCTQYLLHSKK